MKLKGKTQWVRNNKHLTFTGITEAGKTTLAREFYAETDRIGLVFNPLGLDDWVGFYADSVSEVKTLLQQGKTRIVFNTHYDEQKAQEQAHEVLSYLYKLHEANSNLKFMLVWDEGHNYGRTGQNSAPLVRAVKEGRNKNIKNIITTQEPQKVNNSVYSQSYLVWFGDVPGWGYSYLKDRHINVEQLEGQAQYNFTVYDYSGNYKAKGVTDPNY